jgi:hypothetical protein
MEPLPRRPVSTTHATPCARPIGPFTGSDRLTMCTVSSLPTEQGYRLGMNRDEQLTRAWARPPAVRRDENGVAAIYPQESGGGTWIACNEGGVTLALLNWYSPEPRNCGTKRRTRGAVIPELIGQTRRECLAGTLKRLSLEGFTRSGLSASSRAKNLCAGGDGMEQSSRPLDYPWRAGTSFPPACRMPRPGECAAGSSCKETTHPDWLWRLHRSHQPQPGPFSICVDRSHAATVSYTEVECAGQNLCMRYVSGTPCLKLGFDRVAPLRRGSDGSRGTRLPVAETFPSSEALTCREVGPKDGISI